MRIIKTKKVKTPERNGKNAGIDLFVPSNFGVYRLYPGKQIKIPSGIRIKVPKGYCLIGFNKSGVSSKHGLIIGACVVDENYTGEIHIHLFNISKEIATIKSNQKIIQFVVLKPNYVEIEEIKNEYDIFKEEDHLERGDGSFGSTGE